jgi:diguanylate cyclase (GGDEF)-like protein
MAADADAGKVQDNEARLARLGVQVDELQAVMVRLLQDLVRTEARLETDHAAQLVAANEQLVLAALNSQTQAEAAAESLKAAAQASALDPLTQLPNRSTLQDRFVQAVAHARRDGHPFALLFIDLDGFKHYNDEHGHPFGDAVLRWVAAQLVSVVREVDTVSRHGGDEFLVLLAELSKPEGAATVAAKLQAAVAEPVTLLGHPVCLTASVGVAIYPDHGETLDELVVHADTAMYASKRQHAGAAQAAPGADAAAHAARAQARLREANEKLVLAALSAQELLAAAELARAHQLALVAAVAEELRNPEAPIRIAAAMLGHSEAEALLLPRVQRVVAEQLTHMSQTLAQLLESSQAPAGGLALHPQPVALGPILDAAIAALGPALAARGQHFAASRPPGELMLVTDGPRLEQIVCNLIDNACRHTPDGGHVSLTAAVEGDRLLLTVADDGIGITPLLLPHVFEPFVQDTHALGFNGVGLGLGLTVVQALVHALGGEISAHSAGARRGSQFVVSLPLAPAAEKDADGDRPD